MPLSEASLQAGIYNGLKAAFTGATSAAAGYTAIADAQWMLIAQVIATAVVTEIQTNALVVGVVTSGMGAGGTVTGTVT